MTQLKPGDRVNCRVKQNTIVNPYKECDSITTFEIVSTDKYGYYLYVPPYIMLKGTVKADRYQCKRLEINKKFLDCDIIFIQSSMICKVHSILDGMNCPKCHEFYEMASPNQDDGTFICWSCRNYPPYR